MLHMLLSSFQVKVRGIRIELEALEQAIVELPAVKHCEAGSRALRSEGLPKTMSYW